MLYISIIITIISVVFYQILQKSISNEVHPIISLIITYIIAIITSVVLYFLFPSNVPLGDSVKKANWASYLLGIAIVGTEIGFLLVYRSGWKLGLATPFITSITTILLATIGLIFFKEHITGLRLIGLIFCVAGIILMNFK